MKNVQISEELVPSLYVRVYRLLWDEGLDLDSSLIICEGVSHC